MEICKACRHPLTVLVTSESPNDEHLAGASSSTGYDYTVDDDVELQCGCHFHWFVVPLGCLGQRTNSAVKPGNVF